jgi:hypothetical protein
MPSFAAGDADREVALARPLRDREGADAIGRAFQKLACAKWKSISGGIKIRSRVQEGRVVGQIAEAASMVECGRVTARGDVGQDLGGRGERAGIDRAGAPRRNVAGADVT